LSALTFVLTLGNAARFAQSRDVGAYLGMCPKQRQSGDRDPQLGISKAGNSYLRKLLAQCAHHILGPFGKDSALRQWGLAKAGATGASNARKRAVIAMARKIAVVMHKMWRTKQAFHAFPSTV
jgi:transposase